MKRKAKILEVVMIRLLGLSWIGFVFYFGLMCVRCFVPGIVIKEGIENRYWPVKYGIGKTVVMTSFRNEFFALHTSSIGRVFFACSDVMLYSCKNLEYVVVLLH